MSGRWRAGFLLGLALSLGAAQAALALSGVGRAALEAGLGHLPATPDELDREIDRLRTLVKGDAATPDQRLALAVALLNRPEAYDIEDVRRELMAAVLTRPALAAALELWIDLVPLNNELQQARRELEARLAAAPADAASHFALARVLLLLGDHGDVAPALAEAVRLDPAYASRTHLVNAIVAAERKRPEDASTEFDACLSSLDPAAADILWRGSRLLANPEELKRFEEVGDDARADFLRGFWKLRDVFPLTAANERFAEHFQRLREARTDYSLRTNGRAYFTSHDSFNRLSPDLPYYSSDVVFDYQVASPLWLDHRGLVFVRHGAPDRIQRSATGTRSETWLYYRWTTQPLLFHFVDRRGVGEHVLTLNLAQAMTVGNLPDDPEQIINSTADFRELYGTRSTFHNLFQRIAVVQSRITLESLLQEEAAMMAGFIREAWTDDTTNLINKDDFLPFAAYSVNYRAADDKVDTVVYYAIPEKESKLPGPIYEFDATIVVFSANWREKVAEAEHHFRYERPAGVKPSKDDLLVGVLQLNGLPSKRYNYAFQVRERHTDKIGISKGELVADYFGGGWVDASELLLTQSVTPATVTSLFERNGQRIVPIPTRTVRRGNPVGIFYELYDLQAGADGLNHYRIETRILQIQQDPSVASKILGIGMNIASLFFPYQVFLAQAGLFGLDVATADPDKGLDFKSEEREGPPRSGVHYETFEFDSKKYPPGVYQLYVTVKDHVSGAISTRSVRFAVVG